MKRYDAARRSMALGMAVMMGVGGITGCGQKETKPAAETTKEVTEVSEQTAAETKTEALPRKLCGGRILVTPTLDIFRQ